MFIVIIFDYGVIVRRDIFFPARFVFFPYSRLSSYLRRLFLYFILFCCSHAQVCGKTLVHEFPISYSHTDWYLLFSLCEGNE